MCVMHTNKEFIMVDLKSMYIEELTDYLKHMGQPAFRAKQLFSWMHEKYVASVDEALKDQPRKV